MASMRWGRVETSELMPRWRAMPQVEVPNVTSQVVVRVTAPGFKGVFSGLEKPGSFRSWKRL
jgi:hypothetical protein